MTRSAQLLINNSHLIDLDSGGGEYVTPLHISVFNLEVSVFENLVLSGADCNKKNREGNSVLHVLMNLYATNP